MVRVFFSYCSPSFHFSYSSLPFSSPFSFLLSFCLILYFYFIFFFFSSFFFLDIVTFFEKKKITFEDFA